MKKNEYVTPQIECIEVEIEDAVLGASGTGQFGSDDMNILPEW